MSHRFFLAVVLLSVWTAAARAQSLSLALAKADVDLSACWSFQDDAAQPVVADELFAVLGLDKNPSKLRWSAGSLRGESAATVFRYLVVFKQPIGVGSILVQSAGHELALLKPDAKLPPDVNDAQAWTTPGAPPSQSGAVLYPLASGTTTRAILLTDRRDRGRSSIDTLALLKPRWQNVAPAALAYARNEYTPPRSSNTAAASLVTTGKGNWASAGKDDKGFVSSPAINEINPEWFMLAWDEPQTLRGLWIDGNLLSITVDMFVGPNSINPRAGTPGEWRRMKKLSERADHGRWILFDEPLVARGVRLNITKTDPKAANIATIHGLHAFRDLGDAPPLELAAPTDASRPPFRIAGALGGGENVTLVVNDAAGRRVRNLVVRQPSTSTSFEQAWDLRDEEGKLVQPGQYQWRAITWPTLQARYEFTVYPNVSQHAPENAPWLTGVNGSGGWMADHSPPASVCTAGDRVYLGATVAESGVSFIECDLAGKKLWGHHSFAAWTGPRYLASDGKTVFVGAQVLGETPDTVWGVDIATKQVRTVVSVPPTSERNRGMKGLAVRGHELVMSVEAPDNWLVNAAAAEDVDLAACYPLYRPARKPRVAYEIVPKPQEDFLRLFRLAGTPPGMEIDGSLIWLQSVRSSLRRQHIMLAFHRPVPLGSVAFPLPDTKDVRVELSVLKPGAPYPPNLDDARQWIPFSEKADEPWDVIPAPEGTLTRALRITFIKGSADDDLLSSTDAKPTKGSDVPDVGFSLDKPAPSRSALTEFASDQGQWLGRLEGMKLLRRRFRSALAGATVRVNSGTVARDGSWDAQRTRPLTEADPGIYALEWKSPQKIRGLTIKEIDGKSTTIEVYTGDAAGPLDIASDVGWEAVGRHEPVRRNHHGGTEADNHAARYTDDYVDFGREITTRAVRLRITEQWTDPGPRGELGVRKDLGGMTIDPCRCRVYGVAPVAYLGGEPPLDSRGSQRIEFYDTASGKLQSEVPIEHSGHVAFHPSGDLYAISGKQIVKVDRAAGKHATFISDLESPTDLVFDSTGQLYVFDGGRERQNVRVYDSAGRYVRSIGKPGGFQPGPWDQQRMGHVGDIDIDHTGQLWCVEHQYFPKRITQWTTAGEFKKEFLGNTPYGGAGVIDPWDKRRLFYGPLEFEIDWASGRSRLKNLTWTGSTPAGEVPIRIGERTYLVTRPQFSEMPCGVVYLYERDHLRLVAAMGPAQSFEPLKRPEIVAALGGKALTSLEFVWSDRDGNEQVDFAEIVFAPKHVDRHGLTYFNRDLGVQFGTVRYEVKEFLSSGVPIYETKSLPTLAGRAFYRLDDGAFYRMGEDPRMKEAALDADGRPRWTYPTEGTGVQRFQDAKPWSRDQVVSQFGVVGHETATTGDLGEFVVVHANTGAWNIWTADGMLVGPLFRDLRDPQALPWSMPRHERGMVLENVTSGQEHFAGYICRTRDDNRFYAVAGHNHASVLEVLGLDQFRRTGGTFTITADDVSRARQWAERHEQQAVYQRARVVDCYLVAKAPEIDGKLDDWDTSSAVRIDPPADGRGGSARFRIAYNDTHLFVAYETSNFGPLKNTGQQWDRLFKSGACVDLQLGVDPQAADDRIGPEPGDLRLLFSYMNDKPAAVLYRAVVPGTPREKQWRVTSPVGEATFDEVVQLADVKIARFQQEKSYALEAAVPLARLGLKPAPGMRLRLDWGLLVSGPDGHEVLQRVYWSNKATGIVADAPSEARIAPQLWGHVRFHDRNQNAADSRLDAVDAGTPGGKAKKELANDIDDILGGIKDAKKK
jgi:hypothetical protein